MFRCYMVSYFYLTFRKDGEEMRDEKRTLECLKKGVRIASQCLDTGVQVQLYVELLNHYLFYFERGNSLITVAMLNQVGCFAANEYIVHDHRRYCYISQPHPIWLSVTPLGFGGILQIHPSFPLPRNRQWNQ